MVRPMVHSQKHIFQSAVATVAEGVIASLTEINAVAVVNKDAANEVEEGSSIKAIFFENWLRGDDTTVGSSYVAIIEKTSGNSDAPTVGELTALDAYQNKKNILWTSQGLINAEGGVATPILRQWIKIPKGKQRFGLGDRLKFHILAQTGSLTRCGMVIFKEYK